MVSRNPKDMATFLDKDLPLLFTANEVQQFALEHRLNKAQTRAVNELQKAAPAVFSEIVETATADPTPIPRKWLESPI